MSLLRNIQAKVEGKTRRAKAKGEEPAPLMQGYTEDGYLVAQVSARDKTPEKVRGGTGFIHASSLIGICPRRHALMAILGSGHKAPRSADRLVWAIGRAVEKHIRDQFIAQVKGAGVLGSWTCACRATRTEGFRPLVKNICVTCMKPQHNYEELTLFDHEYRIVGNPDIPYVRPDNGKVRVCEIKSMNKKDFDALGSAKGDHVWQALIYRRMFQRNGAEVDDNVSIVYGCKDYSFKGSPYLEFTVKVTPEHEKNLDRMWESAATIRDFVASSKKEEIKTTPVKLPPKIALCPHKNTITAKGCDQCHSCFSII